MRVLVTRPEADAVETAAKLAARGHEAMIAPLLTIHHRMGPEIALENVQAVLITGANGIHALGRRTHRRDVAVLAVGLQSADAARAEGFLQVRHADGDARALADLAASELSPDKGVLLHASGSETRCDLAEKLVASGFSLHREILYDAIAPASLPERARESLVQGTLDAALFFSPRTAKIFVDLVAHAKLGEACAPIRAFCISEATARSLGGLTFRKIEIADRPNQDALLARIDRVEG